MAPLSIVRNALATERNRIGSSRILPLTAIIATGNTIRRAGRMLGTEIAETVQANAQNALGYAFLTGFTVSAILIIRRIAQSSASRTGLLQRGSAIHKEEADAVTWCTEAAAVCVIHVIVERHMQTVFADDRLVVQHRTFRACAVIGQLQVAVAFMPLDSSAVFFACAASGLRGQACAVFYRPAGVISEIAVLESLLQELGACLTLRGRLYLIRQSGRLSRQRNRLIVGLRD